jgi:hypothetical protein
LWRRKILEKWLSALKIFTCLRSLAPFEGDIGEMAITSPEIHL